LSKIKTIIKQRKKANTKLLSLKSKVYEKFLEMEKTTYKDGALKKKEKELIAIGVSTVINCESCMQWHITEAVKSGSTFKEIFEAIEVAIEFGGGPATVSARFALEVLETLFNDCSTDREILNDKRN
jgi:AhpD family alkylhydroperoxidase